MTNQLVDAVMNIITRNAGPVQKNWSVFGTQEVADKVQLTVIREELHKFFESPNKNADEKK
jgi:hypothetical protein